MEIVSCILFELKREKENVQLQIIRAQYNAIAT